MPNSSPQRLAHGELGRVTQLDPAVKPLTRL